MMNDELSPMTRFSHSSFIGWLIADG